MLQKNVRRKDYSTRYSVANGKRTLKIVPKSTKNKLLV